MAFSSRLASGPSAVAGSLASSSSCASSGFTSGSLAMSSSRSITPPGSTPTNGSLSRSASSSRACSATSSLARARILCSTHASAGRGVVGVAFSAACSVARPTNTASSSSPTTVSISPVTVGPRKG
ncbi:hypothetical_protein (plasmid) [Leishmania braziliensis MHOM/BR/75/M2904]|uniref:Hypothetical_protein n=1 Tax=Leishmania braziliensis MHOM/BR/75/M2904 TaxID=420245 RepID=A0A3P3Z1T4_LEIBR|nr:unnamed protein product [Leishmania braziliensis]CAJ2469323.1 unnamed protein product [Leishmania braziliensis]SYZ64183.1 hypothetical_protein [Leishmania braziliensis MHOM/BR/75/M2904]